MIHADEDRPGGAGGIVFAVVNLVVIPPALVALGLLLILATAACGNICNEIWRIWQAAAAIALLEGLIWLWALVAVIRKRVGWGLIAALLLVDATLITGVVAVHIGLS